jgi:hypothetical protein
MVSVSAGDIIDPDHFDDLARQLVDKYSTVYGQELYCLRSDSFNSAGTINDVYIERLAIDIATFYRHTQDGVLNAEQAFDTIFSNTSNINDGNDSYSSGVQVSNTKIRHEDVNQMQNGIDLAHLAGAPSYTTFGFTGRWVQSNTNIAADDDAAKIKSAITVTWDNSTSYTVTTTYAGGTSIIDGNNNNKIRYFSQCGGRIVMFGEGVNSSGTSKDNDVKNMIDSISYVHNPWPLTNIQLSENWNSYTVLQTVNSGSDAYSDNQLLLVCRRDSTNQIHYALRYTDASDGQGSGTGYTEADYDEAVTTDFKLTVNAYYPNHLVNDYKPDVNQG